MHHSRYGLALGLGMTLTLTLAGCSESKDPPLTDPVGSNTNHNAPLLPVDSAALAERAEQQTGGSQQPAPNDPDTQFLINPISDRGELETLWGCPAGSGQSDPGLIGMALLANGVGVVVFEGETQATTLAWKYNEQVLTLNLLGVGGAVQFVNVQRTSDTAFTGSLSVQDVAVDDRKCVLLDVATSQPLDPADLDDDGPDSTTDVTDTADQGDLSGDTRDQVVRGLMNAGTPARPGDVWRCNSSVDMDLALSFHADGQGTLGFFFYNGLRLVPAPYTVDGDGSVEITFPTATGTIAVVMATPTFSDADNFLSPSMVFARDPPFQLGCSRVSNSTAIAAARSANNDHTARVQGAVQRMLSR